MPASTPSAGRLESDMTTTVPMLDWSPCPGREVALTLRSFRDYHNSNPLKTIVDLFEHQILKAADSDR
jgi:hypothetical protein